MTVRGFFKSFIEFYDTLAENEKEIYRDRSQIAQKIVTASSEFPLQTILYRSDIGHCLDLNNRVTFNKELFDYIADHPAFNKPFPIVRAIEDLRAAAGK